MARKFLTPIDLGQLELRNAVVQNLSGSPSTPTKGQIYFDSTTNVLYYYNGAGWVNAGGISAGILSARPTVSSANAGSFYYATDNGLLYYSNGTTWTSSNFFGSPANLAATATDGTALTYARSDHVHRHAGADHTAIKLSDLSNSLSANVDFSASGFTLRATTPVNALDVANKGYVDNISAGLNAHDAVEVATTGTLAGTYVSGTTDASGGLGIGAYIIASANGFISIDAVSTTSSPVAFTTGTRVLVKDGVTVLAGAASIANGIYYIAAAGDVGSGSTPWKLTRASDNDNSIAGELAAGDFVFVIAGTANANQGFVMNVKGTGTPAGTIKIATDGVKWTQFSGGGGLTGSAPISIAGNVVSVSNASTTAVGVASFNNTNFTVSSGAVSANAVTFTAGAGITLSTTSVNLGGSVTFTNAGVTSLSAGTGVSVSGTTGGITLTNSGVISVAGTTNRVTVSTSTGAVTFNLPQDIDTNAGPQFGFLGVGQGYNNQQRMIVAPISAYYGASSGTAINIPSSSPTLIATTSAAIAAAISIGAQTYSTSTTSVITDAASLYISAPPAGSGSLTVTNAWGILAASSNIKALGFYGSGANLTSLDAGSISTGTLAVARGGTGTTATATTGYFLVGTGSAYAPRVLAFTDLVATTATATSSTTAAAITAQYSLSQKLSVTFTGNGALTSFTITHGLGRFVHVQVGDSTGLQVECDVTNTATTTQVSFATAPTNGTIYYCTIIG
jgi:hypothetical protein